VSLLEENLSEEEQTVKALTLVAGFSRNPSAAKHDSPKNPTRKLSWQKP